MSTRRTLSSKDLALGLPYRIDLVHTRLVSYGPEHAGADADLEQVRRIQFGLIHTNQFDDLLTILNELGCPIRESNDQAGSLVSERPSSTAATISTNTQHRKFSLTGNASLQQAPRSELAPPQPSPVKSSRPPSQWFRDTECRPLQTVSRPHTDIGPIRDFRQTISKAQAIESPPSGATNLPPPRKLPFDRSRSNTPLTPLNSKRKASEILVSNSQAQQGKGQSPYFKKPRWSQSLQGPDSRIVQETQSPVDQYPERARERSLTPPPPISSVKASSSSGLPSLPKPAKISDDRSAMFSTSDSVLSAGNAKAVTNTTAAATSNDTIMTQFSSILPTCDPLHELQQYANMTEQQRMTHLENLVYTLTKDQTFITLAADMQKCWQRLGLEKP